MALRDRRKGSRGRAGPKGRPVTAIVGASVVLVLLIAGFLWGVVKSNQVAVPIDDLTLCPTSQPPAEVVAMLIDVSDTPSTIQSVAIKNEVLRVVNSLQPLVRLEIFSLSPSVEAILQPELAICNPGTGQDMSPIYQNPDLARKRWEEQFKGRLQPIIDRELGAQESPQSPLYEAIQSIAVAALGRPEFDDVPKRLVLVSDMIQHVSPGASHYSGIPSVEKLRGESYFNRIRADLSGLEVQVIYIQRAEFEIQGLDHIRFWEDYFAIQGARLVEVKRVFG